MGLDRPSFWDNALWCGGYRAMTKVTDPSGTVWTVRRLVVPLWMRPASPTEAVEAHAHSRMAGPGFLVGVVLCVVCFPLVPVAVMFRVARLTPWTIQASVRLWGRRGPRTVMRWEVKGSEETSGAIAQLIAGIEAGEYPPRLAGAERID